MRGGFGSRGRSNGFERPLTSTATIETLEQALYPPTRPFYYFPPSTLSQASTSQGPRIPSASLDLCRHAKPLPAAQVFGATTSRGSSTTTVNSNNKIVFEEGPSTTSSNTVGTLEEIAHWVDAASCSRDRQTCPKLAQDDALVARLIGPQGYVQFSMLHGLLPPELRVFCLHKDALTDSEKRALFRIKPRKKPRLEKPIRRGGVVISATAPKDVNRGAASSSMKTKVSAFVDIAAAEGEEKGGKRVRDENGELAAAAAEDGGSDREGGAVAEDDENSVSSMGENDDDDDAVDDMSGGGSGDEMTF
jgi:hypothetical protein